MDVSIQGSEIAVRLALAVLFGGSLGFEREWQRKPAGLRTHMMVCLGAATFTIIGFELHASLVAADAGITRSDPLRILQGIIGGLGFLGAGAILRRGPSVEGLTTAASLWLTGAVGVAVGGGQYAISALACALGLVTLFVVARLEHRLIDRRSDDAGDLSP